MKINNSHYILIFLTLLTPLASRAQESVISVDDAVTLALERNPTVQAMALESARQYALKKTAFDIPKTDFTLMYGQYNSIAKNDNNLTITQSIPFPTFFSSQLSLSKAQITSAELKERMTRNELTFQVRQVFNQLVYLKARQTTLLQHDSLLTDLARVSAIQYRTGSGTLLAKTSGETQLFEIKNLIARNEADSRTALNQLQLLCQAPQILDIKVPDVTIGLNEIDSFSLIQNPSIAFAAQQVDVSRKIKKLEVSRALPDIRFGYFNQTLIGTQNVDGQDQYFGSGKRFQGFQVGLSIPLWFGPHTARIKAASLATDVAQKQKESFELSITQQYNQAVQELIKNRNSLNYYNESALATAALLSAQSRKAYQSGELDYALHLLNLRQALAIREGYLLAVQQLNQSIIILQFLNGNQ